MKIVLAAIAILLNLISVLPSVGEGTQFSNGGIHAEARKTHWLTISGNIRHNKSCRWYHNSKGRPCRKDEGRACKVMLSWSCFVLISVFRVYWVRV